MVNSQFNVLSQPINCFFHECTLIFSNRPSSVSNSLPSNKYGENNAGALNGPGVRSCNVQSQEPTSLYSCWADVIVDRPFYIKNSFSREPITRPIVPQSLSELI